MSTLKRIEGGTTHTNTERLLMVCKAIGCDMESLLAESEIKQLGRSFWDDVDGREEHIEEFLFNDPESPEINYMFDKAQIKEILDRCEEGREIFSGDKEFANAYAVMLGSYIICKPGIEKVKEALGRLKELHDEFPGDEELANAYAHGLVIYSSYLPDFEIAEETLGHLEALREKHPRVEEIVFQYACGLGNYIGLQEDKEKAEAALDQLEALVNEYRNSDINQFFASLFDAVMDSFESKGK